MILSSFLGASQGGSQRPAKEASHELPKRFPSSFPRCFPGASQELHQVVPRSFPGRHASQDISPRGAGVELAEAPRQRDVGPDESFWSRLIRPGTP